MLRVFLLLICFALAISAQEPPKAVLVDEFANEFCSDPLRSRIDNFFTEISRRPDWVGYVIGNADEAIPGRFERYFDLFHNHARFRGFDVNKIKLYRRANGDSTAFQFWVAPSGAKPPGLPTELRPRTIETATLFDASRINSIQKGQVEFGEYSESSEPCDFGLSLSQFAAAVNSDKDLQAYLLATSGRGRSKALVLKALDVSSQTLSKKQGIALNRIKRIYAGKRDEAIMQLWLVPNGSTPPKFRENSVP
jgi:hypothetical protein